MPLTVIRNDITKMSVDAIVNAANEQLQAGGGVCGAIFSAAGADRLQRACDKHAPIKTGEAVITGGFSLPAKYIIHAAGPVYRDGKHNEEALLRSCYKNALDLARAHKCESIAFPLISSGIYGYPKDEALAVATSAIGNWLMEDDMEVSLVVFDKTAFALSTRLLGEVRAFVDEHYVDERNSRFSRELSSKWIDSELYSLSDSDSLASPFPDSDYLSNVQWAAERAAERAAEHFRIEESQQTEYAARPMMPKMRPPSAAPISAKKASVDSHKRKKQEDIVVRLDEPFSVTLLRLIDTKGKTDVEVYKHANLDRKLFSKIRTGKGYMPSKKTAVALAVALELSLSETRDLLERAGFALSRSVVFDVIIEYFISQKRYDVFEINNVLFEYDQPLLGG